MIFPIILPHLMNENAKNPKSQVTCPKLHSWGVCLTPNLKPQDRKTESFFGRGPYRITVTFSA